MRKERREKLRKENGLMHRFVRWTKSKSKEQGNEKHPAVSSVETDRTDSSSSDDEIGIAVDEDSSSSSSTYINPDDINDDNTDHHGEPSGENAVWYKHSNVGSNIVGIRDFDKDQKGTSYNGRE